MTRTCPKSEYKDDRHDYFVSPVLNTRLLRVRDCVRCGQIELQELVDSGSQAGDIWETIAEGARA